MHTDQPDWMLQRQTALGRPIKWLVCEVIRFFSRIESYEMEDEEAVIEKQASEENCASSDRYGHVVLPVFFLRFI